MYVHCPNCEETYRHDFTGEWAVRHLRSPDCSIRRYDNSCYEIRFPFNEISDNVGYEINKQRALFLAGEADPTEYFLEHELIVLRTESWIFVPQGTMKLNDSIGFEHVAGFSLGLDSSLSRSNI